MGVMLRIVAFPTSVYLSQRERMSKRKMTCPSCAEVELTRVARHGFLQERVYPKFGMYPWECTQCRQIFLLKSRGYSYRKAGPRTGSEK